MHSTPVTLICLTLIWSAQAARGGSECPLTPLLVRGRQAYLAIHSVITLTKRSISSTLKQCVSFQNIRTDWKSDPLDRAGAEGHPPKAPQVFFLGGSVRYRYKRDLRKQTRVTPPKNVDYGKYITHNEGISGPSRTHRVTTPVQYCVKFNKAFKSQISFEPQNQGFRFYGLGFGAKFLSAKRVFFT
jgi:hypothetical protein